MLKLPSLDRHLDPRHSSFPSAAYPSPSASRLFSQRRAAETTNMTTRPLDQIRAQARAADRRHRQHRRATYMDTIDALDTIGGFYHHGGPYDAALASSNVNPRYSPLAAVHDSNMEAIRATPRENLIDSLTRHVPLQGTASVAPGARDMSGRLMEYAEGADLMRESDAPGGAYKRWPGLGKSEPSYTLERDLGSHKQPHRRNKRRSMPGASAFEMLPGVNGRPRRASSAFEASPFDASPPSSAVPRNGSPPSASKRLNIGPRRRLGSLHGGRKKKSLPGRSDGD